MSSPNPTNLIDVESPEHFQELLSRDLQRVSLINFWAPWAEPCKQMNQVVLELAKKYEDVLVLQVEAEMQEDISESFEIQSVPSFILLRGHTLLSRISGADAAKLTQDLAKFTRKAPIQALSKTDLKPAAGSDERTRLVHAHHHEKMDYVNDHDHDHDEEEAPEYETAEELEKRMTKLMNKSKVVLFMKGNPDQPRCGFSRKTVELLRSRRIEFSTFDILGDERVRAGLKVLNDWPTFPQLIINGEFVGGLDVVREMADNGELEEMVTA